MFQYSNKERSKRRRVQNNFNDLLNDPQLKGNPIFKNLLIFIDQDTVNVSRRGVLHRLIDKYGGRFTTTLSNYVTHVLVDEGFYNGRLSNNFTWTSYPQHMEVIMVTWLSASINANMCLNTAGYRVRSNYRSNLYENIHSYIQDAAYSSNGKDGSSEGTKFDYVSEENSTFDDGKYDDETSCEDEWLLSEPPDIYILPTNPIDNDWLPLKRKEKCPSEIKKVYDVAVASASTVTTKDSSEKKVPTEAPFASSNPIVARLSKVRVRMIPKHLRGPGEGAVVVELNNENDPPLPFERTKNVDPVKTDVSTASNDLKETPMSDSKATSGTIDTEVKNSPPTVSSSTLCDEINGSLTTPSDLNLSSTDSKCVTSLVTEHPNEQASSDHVVKCESTENEKELPIPENILCEKRAELTVEGSVSKEKDIDSSIKGTEETLSDSNVISECKESNKSETSLLNEDKINQLPSKTEECIMNSSCDSTQIISNQNDTIECNDKTLISKQVSESTCELNDKNQTIESKDESVLKSSSGHSEKQPLSESVNVSESLSSDSLDKNRVKEVNNTFKPENEGKLEYKTQVLNEKQVCDDESSKNESKENAKSLIMESGHRFSGNVIDKSKKFSNEKIEAEQTDDISESEVSSKDHEDESESSAKESESKSRRRKFDSSSAEVSDEPLTKKSKDGKFTVEIIDSSSEYSSDDSVVILSSDYETMQNASTNNDSYATGSSDFQSTDNNEVYPLNLYCSSTAGFADSEHVSCEESSTDGITSEVNFSIQRSNGATERINSERFRECINNDTATYVIVNQLKGIPAHCLPSENPAFDDEYDTISTLDFNKNSSSTSSSPIINTSYQPPRSFSLTNISDPEFPFPIPEPSTSNLQGHFKALGHHSHGRVISTRPDNPNLAIINKLKILYECHKQVGCRWRIHAYEKAIITLSKQYKRVSSIKEAKTLKGVSKTIAGKIWRIAKTGDLREIQEIHNRRWVETMKLFTRVWGISPRIAFQLYKEGFCTIYGLQKKSNLSRGHLVGLRYYEDLKTKMSQEETRLIVSAVLKEVFKMYPNLRADACSSLRRKKLRCGHACILLSLPPGVPNDHRILPDIVARLHQIGFLIDDLIRHEENGNQTRYVGICRLSKKNKHRRLCVTLTTKEEHPTALMYLTGPAYFNKAMQQWAIKREMVLDEHSLRYRILNILGGTEYVSKLHVSDESLIFQFMGLPYRAPEHRERIS